MSFSGSKIKIQSESYEIRFLFQMLVKEERVYYDFELARQTMQNSIISHTNTSLVSVLPEVEKNTYF